MIVRKEVGFHTSPANLWELLVNGEHTKKYMFGCEPDSGWKEGDPLLWKADNKVLVKGKIRKIIPEKVLHYTTFDPNLGLEDVEKNYMLVTYDIIPKEHGCVLKITQGDFSNTQDALKKFEESVKGWDYVINGIKSLI